MTRWDGALEAPHLGMEQAPVTRYEQVMQALNDEPVQQETVEVLAHASQTVPGAYTLQMADAAPNEAPNQETVDAAAHAPTYSQPLVHDSHAYAYDATYGYDAAYGYDASYAYDATQYDANYMHSAYASNFTGTEDQDPSALGIHHAYPNEAQYIYPHDPTKVQRFSHNSRSSQASSLEHSSWQSHDSYAEKDRKSAAQSTYGTEPVYDGPWHATCGAMYGADEAKTLAAMHVDALPQRKYQSTTRNVALTYDNLVLNFPIPSKLNSFVHLRDAEEYTHLRYSAVTCGPEMFLNKNFTLRQTMYNRHTEIFIGITIHDKDETYFTRTLHGVMKNIAHLCALKDSRVWGRSSWNKVVVAIIADGREHLHPRVLDCLAAIGVYQEGIAKSRVDNDEVQAHVYEYTTQLSIDRKIQFRGAEDGIVPVQLLLCLKEKRTHKNNSHRWFFDAFSRALQPTVCILLDAGTKPAHKSIYKLWRCFERNARVAGAFGGLSVDTNKRAGFPLALLNPLVAAQQFAYKSSNTLKMPTESVLGHTCPAPGAPIAYRYAALLNDPITGSGPLASYFKGEAYGNKADAFLSNMCAEDLVLSFELVAKQNARWIVQYVESAKGITAAPHHVSEFITQQQQWSNGPFLSTLYAWKHAFRFMQSAHSGGRKTALSFEMVYSFITMVVAWFSVANCYIFFRVLTRGMELDRFGLHGIPVVNEIMHFIYIGTLIACFVLALGNRPQSSEWKYTAVVVIFALLALYMLFAGIFCIVNLFQGAPHSTFAQTMVGFVATYAVYIVGALLALDPWHLLTCSLQYLLLVPTYIKYVLYMTNLSVLHIYAFCNLYDANFGGYRKTDSPCHLGTATSTEKGTVQVSLPSAQTDIDAAYEEALFHVRDGPSSSMGRSSTQVFDYYKNVRTNVLLLWSLSNALLAGIILDSDLTHTFDPQANLTRARVYVLVVLVRMLHKH
ncbi:chitin synthase [Malassezia vespertilionis]|uniref:chitin synthase n=1 Tax=Malassezia vespertilionis TaxID=2020962 RepID=UPI0024B27F13|nr:chitin synthase [Malassezia vespertilionis]WFD06235.1 chitin synthase [Malassezia vespertilionis]